MPPPSQSHPPSTSISGLVVDEAQRRSGSSSPSRNPRPPLAPVESGGLSLIGTCCLRARTHPGEHPLQASRPPHHVWPCPLAPRSLGRLTDTLTSSPPRPSPVQADPCPQRRPPIRLSRQRLRLAPATVPRRVRDTRPSHRVSGAQAKRQGTCTRLPPARKHTRSRTRPASKPPCFAKNTHSAPRKQTLRCTTWCAYSTSPSTARQRFNFNRDHPLPPSRSSPGVIPRHPPLTS